MLRASVAVICFLGYLWISGCGRFDITPEGRLARDKKELATATSPLERFYALGHLAKDSFDAGKFEEARSYAEELERVTPSYKGDWNYGNAVQDSNIVLGRLALRDGNVLEAKRRLTAAGNSPGSPQMNSFGPNMSLARDLLLKGEKEPVLDYFKQCRSFWMSKDKLDAWATEVNAGQIPHFGANLIY